MSMGSLSITSTNQNEVQISNATKVLNDLKNPRFHSKMCRLSISARSAGH